MDDSLSSRVDLRRRAALLWGLARPNRNVLLAALALALASSATGLVAPLATRSVLDTLDRGDSLARPVLLLVALLVAGAVLGRAQWALLGRVAERVVHDARTTMVRRYLRAQVFPLLARPAGDLVTRVTSDSVLLRQAVSTSVIALVNGVVLVVGSLVLMAVLDLVLVLATLVAVVVVVALFSSLMPGIARARERSQSSLGALGAELEGTLRAVRTVKAARAEGRQLARLTEHSERARAQSMVAVRRESTVWAVSWAGVQAAIIAVLALGAWRVSGGAMTVPTLIAFLLYTFGLLDPIVGMSTSLSTLQAGLAAAARIHEVDTLEAEPEARGSAPGDLTGRIAALPAHAPLVELRGVTAGYGTGAEVLQGLDLAVPRRGHVALVGPSGAGKTTVFSLMLGFVQPSAGELRLADVPYARLGTDEVRRHLAYVEQETPVVPGTIRDNLLFVNPDADEAEVAAVLERVRLADTVAALPKGLDNPLRDSSLSGGQRQRVALARALLADAEVLLLDEATAQLDGLTEAAIQEAVREQARHGLVVTIAHRLSTVLDADEIVVMEAGRVAARGTHTGLLRTSGLYRALVAALKIETGDTAAAAGAAPLQR
jgi:ABC-type multidrug transport system fused ATPase/permease subunit